MIAVAAKRIASVHASAPAPREGPRVDLHQLEGTVARVALELPLREAVERERAQQLQALLDDLVHPERLADAAGADARRRLSQLAPTEEAERLAVGAQVRAERVELVVAARDQLLHERLVRLGLRVGLLGVRPGLAAEGLALEASLEALGRG